MLRFEFCRLSEIDDKVAGIIRRRMSWRDGDMREWLREGRQDVYLCLVYKRHLITWVALNSNRDLTAWTTARYRKCGYAQMAAWELIKHRRRVLDITEKTVFYVYHSAMAKVVVNLGFKVHNYG